MNRDILPSRPQSHRLEPAALLGAHGQEPSIHELAGLLLRHRWLIAACIVLCGAAGAIYTLRATPIYEAKAVVGFEAQRVDVPQLVQAVYNDNVIGTELEVLTGRTAAMNVIDSLGLRASLVAPRRARITALFSTLQLSPTADSGTFAFKTGGDGTFTVSRPKSTQSLGLAHVGEPLRLGGLLVVLAPAASALPEFTLRVALPDDAVRQFASALKVSRPARDADVIAIQAQAADPVQATAIANLMASNLIADRQTASASGTRSPRSLSSSIQADSLGRQLRASEDSLRNYREREHVIDVPEEASAEVAPLFPSFKRISPA